MAKLKAGADGRRQRTDGATAERQARFLEGLAQTCHVGRAAMMAGKKDAGIFYRLRLHDAAFARKWDEAVASARARIEAALMARAMEAVEAGAVKEAEAGAAPMPPLDFDKVMQLLRYYRTAPAGGVHRGPKRRYATREETDAALMARLDVVEARVKARQARERAERRAARAARKAAAEAVAEA